MFGFTKSKQPTAGNHIFELSEEELRFVSGGDGKTKSTATTTNGTTTSGTTAGLKIQGIAGESADTSRPIFGID